LFCTLPSAQAQIATNIFIKLLKKTKSYQIALSVLCVSMMVDELWRNVGCRSNVVDMTAQIVAEWLDRKIGSDRDRPLPKPTPWRWPVWNKTLKTGLSFEIWNVQIKYNINQDKKAKNCYKSNLCTRPIIKAFFDWWSLLRGGFLCYKNLKCYFIIMVVINRWSLFEGGSWHRFDWIVAV
jgi:hypothetical protein